MACLFRLIGFGIARLTLCIIVFSSVASAQDSLGELSHSIYPGDADRLIAMIDSAPSPAEQERLADALVVMISGFYQRAPVVPGVGGRSASQARLKFATYAHASAFLLSENEALRKKIRALFSLPDFAFGLVRATNPSDLGGPDFRAMIERIKQSDTLALAAIRAAQASEKLRQSTLSLGPRFLGQGDGSIASAYIFALVGWEQGEQVAESIYRGYGSDGFVRVLEGASYKSSVYIAKLLYASHQLPSGDAPVVAADAALRRIEGQLGIEWMDGVLYQRLGELFLRGVTEDRAGAALGAFDYWRRMGRLSQRQVRLVLEMPDAALKLLSASLFPRESIYAIAAPLVAAGLADLDFSERFTFLTVHAPNVEALEVYGEAAGLINPAIPWYDISDLAQAQKRRQAREEQFSRLHRGWLAMRQPSEIPGAISSVAQPLLPPANRCAGFFSAAL
jgi:hypothetical protein